MLLFAPSNIMGAKRGINNGLYDSKPDGRKMEYFADKSLDFV